MLEYLRKLDEKLLLSPKIIYVTVCMVFYCVHLFRAQFFKDFLRLKDSQYGDVSALMALVSFATMTAWGTLADALGRHRTVLALLCVALATSFEITYFMAGISSLSSRFYLSALILSFYALFSAGILPLTDYLTLRLLSSRPGFSRDLYSRQRLWGTVSYAFTNTVVGWFIHHLGITSLYYLFPIFSVLCVTSIFLLAPSDSPKPLSEVFAFIHRKSAKDAEKEVRMEGMEGVKQEVDQTVSSEKGSKSPSHVVLSPNSQAVQLKEKQKSPLLQLLQNPKYMFMLMVVFMTGSARAVMTTFLSKYWREKVDLTSKQVSNAANLGVVMEVVIFFFGPACLHQFGVYWLLIFGQLSMVIRCWAYVQIPADKSSWWMVYLVELLKGVAFGFTQISGVKLASEAAPKGLEATAQALYTSVYSQLPTVLTAFVGGRAYKNTRMLFMITAIVSTFALVLFIAKYMWDGSIHLFGLGRSRRSHDNDNVPPHK